MLKVVFIVGHPLNNPLKLPYVGTCVDKEARKDVTERTQLAA